MEELSDLDDVGHHHIKKSLAHGPSKSNKIKAAKHFSIEMVAFGTDNIDFSAPFFPPYQSITPYWLLTHLAAKGARVGVAVSIFIYYSLLMYTHPIGSLYLYVLYIFHSLFFIFNKYVIISTLAISLIFYVQN